MNSLLDLVLPLQSWLVLPLLAISAIALTFILRAPQLARLGEGWRALKDDLRAPGDLSPASALALSVAATCGAGAIVGTATAISLGGPGAVAWLWLFGLLVAPLRFAEVLLARSAPPGKAGRANVTGSLGARLLADGDRRLHPIGTALTALVPIAALAVVGGLHGAALGETAEVALPGSAIYLAVGAAAGGLALILLPQARAAIGWVGLAGFGALLVALFFAIFDDLGRSFTLFPRAIEDAFSGSAEVGAFTGALVAEITRASIMGVMPSLTSSLGADGAIHALARASSARSQAAAAIFGTLAHVCVVTLVGMAIVGTGAFSRRVEGERRLSEVRWVDSAYETVSQRMEHERDWTGYLRVVDGEMSGDPRPVGIERSMVGTPLFEELDGTPADFALHVTDGEIGRLLRRDADGALDMAPEGEADRILVVGSMLPRGGALLLAAVHRGGGELAERLLLAALVVLCALLVAAWGLAARSALTADLGEGPGRAGLGLAALGLVLGASGIAPFLGPIAAIAGALLAIAAILGLLGKLRELSVLVAPGTASVSTAAVSAPAPAKKKSRKK
jgi:AGCS family alanine or glycine:cation symporter